MAKQSQPKVSEMLEVLIQQMSQFEKVITERNDVLATSISKLEYMKVDFNVEELEAMKQSNREILQVDFENFHIQTNKNNEQLLKIHKKVSSKRLLYIIILNFLLLTTTGLSMYVAIKNTITKSEFKTIVNERDKMKSQINNFESFLSANRTITEKYTDWIEK